MENTFLNRNKKGGVVLNTIFGVGGLIIGIIVVFLITTTLYDANLLTDDSKTTTRTDQNVSLVTETGKTFGNNTLRGASCTVNAVSNRTGGLIINSGNYTVISNTCTIKYNGGAGGVGYNNSDWNINSTTAYAVDSEEKSSVNNLTTDFVSGIDNVSEKIPTILLIIAVVLLFGVLVLLLRQSKGFGIGGIGGNEGSI